MIFALPKKCIEERYQVMIFQGFSFYFPLVSSFRRYWISKMTTGLNMNVMLCSAVCNTTKQIPLPGHRDKGGM